MPIWNKYKIIKEIDSKSNIKTYLTKIEPIVKEEYLKINLNIIKLLKDQKS